jgi:Lrp/AsnC family transcriptional regulator for asnA, asnC and gidA
LKGSALTDDDAHDGIDDLDKGIIALLRREPRASNRDMADALKVSEVTVGNRIRSLAERNLMKVVAQEDIWALGYELVVLVDVFVAGRPAEDVALDLAALEQTGSVSVTMTSPELIVQVFARDRADLLRVLETEIGRIRGISGAECLLVLEALKFRSDFGELASP